MSHELAAGAGVTKAPGMRRDSNGNPIPIGIQCLCNPLSVRPSLLQTAFNTASRFDRFESCLIVPTTWPAMQIGY